MKFFNTLSLTTITFSLFALISTQQTNAFWPFTSNDDVCQRIRDRSNITIPYIPQDLEKEGDREYCEELRTKVFKRLKEQLKEKIERVSNKDKSDTKRLEEADRAETLACLQSEEACREAAELKVAILRTKLENSQEKICLSQYHLPINNGEAETEKLLNPPKKEDASVTTETENNNQASDNDEDKSDDNAKEEISVADMLRAVEERNRAVQEQNRRKAQMREQKK